jgi:prepilin-type N-terminal cleavage/methylation domain-containing protein/prepilin-type processing-associated H-X9-DG protein
VGARGQSGFTLVELMIVVVVVGILASVAIPMYQLAAERSKATEADSGLGAIRSAMRVYYAEHGTYVNASFVDGSQVTVGGVLSVKDSDLLGRYFSSPCYTFDGAPTAAAFSIECDGGAVGNVAPHASEVSGIVRTINEDGDIG